ncbi:hypothetical protein B0T16DRAFT_196204 [Cercophora newfieldiana]|uniref:Uncharacterized protein n=1 Tax=Cercophora newfieldiana TaxID=92897 RepID=A0AA40CMZ4_9PEZI|nr:hypothetical protein B0T16DRAFT_196204 [Cercophora newfieldiana]
MGLSSSLIPNPDDDTVSICSEDADGDDFRLYNISGQGWIDAGDHAMELKPSSFKTPPGHDPKKVVPSSGPTNHGEDLPLVRHGDAPNCAHPYALRFETDTAFLITTCFPGLEAFYMIDYSIALHPEMKEVPLDRPHWFDNAGGVYIDVVEGDGRWVFDDSDPFRRSVFEFTHQLESTRGDWGIRRDLPDCRIGVMAYVKLDGLGRFSGLIDGAIGDSFNTMHTLSGEYQYSSGGVYC